MGRLFLGVLWVTSLGIGICVVSFVLSAGESIESAFLFGTFTWLGAWSFFRSLDRFLNRALLAKRYEQSRP